MRIIKPLVIVETEILTDEWGKKLEYMVRKCYKSEAKTTEDSYSNFIRKIFQTIKHEGIIEHFTVSATMITDRGVSHEHVRHRMATYLQESTRYVDYSGKGVTFILPPWVKPYDIACIDEWEEFISDCAGDEKKYNKWRTKYGWKPQQARYWLPNGIKTEYVATHNLGSWYNFFRKRTAVQAHPQIRQLAIPLLRHFQEKLPMIFDGIELPVLDYPEAKLILHYGSEQIDSQFEEVYSSVS